MRYRIAVGIGRALVGFALLSCAGTDTVTGPSSGQGAIGTPAAGPLSNSVPTAGPASGSGAVAGVMSAAWPGGPGVPQASAPVAAAATGSAPAMAAVTASAAGRLLWQKPSTEEHSIWELNSTWSPRYVVLPTVVPSGWLIVGTGDFDADGHADIVWENLTTTPAQRSIWYMSGNEYRGRNRLLPSAPAGWSISTVADMNADRKPDLVWTFIGIQPGPESDEGQRSIWFMKGIDGTTVDRYGILPKVAIGWKIVGAGDLDGDSRTDLVWENLGEVPGRRHSIWFLGADQRYEGRHKLLPSVPDGWSIAAVGDLTADLHPDLVWQRLTTGERSVWVMNRSTAASFVLLRPTVSDTEWDIAAVLPPFQIELVANAGDDQDRNRGEQTTLNGSGSRAPAGATYTWRQVSGPDVTGETGLLTGISPSFRVPSDVSTLEFDLTVTSGGVTSSADRVVIFVFEDKARAIFVGPDGNDVNAGTRSSPVRNIITGIGKAASIGGDVYVRESDGYDELVVLRSGVSVYGGYSSGWIRDWQRHITRIVSTSTFDAIGFKGTDISDATVDGFTIETHNGFGLNQSTYGVFLVRPRAGVVLSNNVILPGRGAPGFTGAVGASGTNGADGARGGDGSANGSTPGAGGVGGTGANNGGTGGRGGIEAQDGQVGQSGVGGTFNGGAGGDWGNPGRTGSPGGNGVHGVNGDNGPGGASFGDVGLGGYFVANGGNGLDGTSGTGGGGGGGGGGQSCTFCDDGSGNGGGGGGGGGGRGRGGIGGSGGAGSFGIFIAGAVAPVAIRSNIITIAGGIVGGGGGQGGIRGRGGFGGQGGDVWTSEIGAGGMGGRGGDGGFGGHGGGGGGGPQIGILEADGIASTKSQNTITIGNPSLGGGSLGNPGQAGAALFTHSLRMTPNSPP